MPPSRSFLLLLALLASGVVPSVAAKKENPPADAPPRLISTQGGGPRWKNSKQLRDLAAQGDPQACFELGARMLEGDEEIVADPDRARALLETAAKGGIADAKFRLGKIHHDARGVPQDYAKALDYYAAAARQGVPEAQHNIGAMLVSGRGVKRDFVEGLAWLLLAEKSGAASSAPQQVRDRLAKRPADIRAAEERARELSADLAHAVVRLGAAPVPVAVPSAPAAAKPLVQPTVSAPRFEPLSPPQIAVPAAPPLPPPPPPAR